MPTPAFLKDFFDATTYYTSPKLTDAMITAVEKQLGFKLPTVYLDLLRVKNGGAPKRQCFPTAGTHWSDNHVRMTALCGIGGRWGIDSETMGSRHMIEQGGFPEVGIFVGWTPTAGHDGIFLDYRECGPQGEPCILFLDAESGDSKILAPNIGVFLEGLVDCRPYEEERQRELDEFKRRSS